MTDVDEPSNDALVVSLSREEWSACAQALNFAQDDASENAGLAERLQTIAANIAQGLEQAPSDFSAQLPHPIWCDCAMALAFVLSQQLENPNAQADFVQHLRAASVKVCAAILPKA